MVRLVRTNEKFISSRELEKNEKIGSALLNDSYLNKDRAGKTEILTIRRTRQ